MSGAAIRVRSPPQEPEHVAAAQADVVLGGWVRPVDAEEGRAAGVHQRLAGPEASVSTDGTGDLPARDFQHAAFLAAFLALHLRPRELRADLLGELLATLRAPRVRV